MSADADLQSIQGRIEGRVQGVSFRAAMQHQARLCGVTGWVRNTPDGAVEFAAQGNRPAVQQLLEWARRGPPGAKVDELNTGESDPVEGQHDFEIRF